MKIFSLNFKEIGENLLQFNQTTKIVEPLIDDHCLDRPCKINQQCVKSSGSYGRPYYYCKQICIDHWLTCLMKEG